MILPKMELRMHLAQGLPYNLFPLFKKEGKPLTDLVRAPRVVLEHKNHLEAPGG